MQDTDTDTEHKPTAANARLRSHGFVTIHSAAIQRNRRNASQPFDLKVTGTYLPPGIAGAPLKMLTKAVATGSRQPLERFARQNNLPIQPTPDI